MTNTTIKSEQDAGNETALREIAEGGWTRETAREFLAAIGALESDPATETPYGQGFNARLRKYAAA